ncbi:hypothetical protein BO82DRAFT_398602 [Aspergillus uvarum CBS 121591]|uniref:Zn(2)-C6 fungal-type domain-containing protein n=1 Tax=Aspergillus uvarum CBS 121591 TaxID=1448315 RepID=A0A319E3S8_9EURO|nr:hypothetical protein BO82DRAFT_398602 [Aspergillus uvarum CBS 121591]PYH85732.1 hypothetical protein BO82DRAFT_398602 [Aspergillus uvarum CBS 121591]
MHSPNGLSGSLSQARESFPVQGKSQGRMVFEDATGLAPDELTSVCPGQCTPCLLLLLLRLLLLLPNLIRIGCHQAAQKSNLDAVASSKVRCSKEKPTCSRCRRRGTVCEYFAIKRPGRKPESRAEGGDSGGRQPQQQQLQLQLPLPALDASRSLPSPEQSSTPTPVATTPVIHGYPPPDAAGIGPSLSPRGLSSELFDGTPTLHPACWTSSTDDWTLSTALTTWCPDNWDDFFSIPVLTDPPDAGGGGGGDGLGAMAPDLFVDGRPAMEQTSVGGMQEDTIYLFGPTAAADPCAGTASLPRAPIPRGGGATPAEEHPRGAATCQCLLDALELLKRFVAEEAAAAHGGMDLDATVTGNSHATTVMTEILHCPCSQRDGYLLILLALVVWKVLDRYAAVALPQSRRSSSSSSSSRSSSSNSSSHSSSHSEETPPPLLAGQRVLGELHGIQRVMNQLRPRLSTYQGGGQASAGLWPHLLPTGPDALPPPPSPPPPPPVAGSLEPELHRRLSHLSAEIIQFLRQAD